MSIEDIIIAWKSHATLRRQSGSEEKFLDIIDEIREFIETEDGFLNVPYTTRIFFSQLM